MTHKTLYFFDLDDTLIQTDCKIHIKKNDTIVAKLSPSEFNTYILANDETYCFIEFRDSSKLKSLEPIDNILNTLIALQNREDAEVIILTARADFDNKNAVIKALQKIGINAGHYKNGQVHVARCGNVALEYNCTTSESKTKTVQAIIQKRQDIKRMALIDDCQKNLKAFRELQHSYTDMRFYTYFVNGGIMQYYA